MSPVGDAGLEQIMARLVELEAHLDSQDRDIERIHERLDETVDLTVATHAYCHEMHAALVRADSDIDPGRHPSAG